MSEATWIEADSRRALPSTDQDRVQRFLLSARASVQAARIIPATLHLIRDTKAGQPQAAHYSPRTPGEYRIDADEGAADGEPPTGHPDASGDAAMTPDKAARHEAQLRKLLDQHAELVQNIYRILVQYPTNVATLEDVEPTPGDEWCRSCWKDTKHCEPISLRPDGTARFPGLCRWCGEFRQANGFEPPTDLLARRHRGERITEPMVTKARAAWRAQHPAKGKVKSKRGKGKHNYQAATGTT